MDKGFNDDELADIMNEIESLEKEFTEEIAPEETAAVAEPHEETAQEQPEMEASEVETVEAVQEETVVEEVEEAMHEEPVQVEAIEETTEVEAIDTEMADVVEELSSMPVEDLEVAQATAHDDSNVHQLRHTVPVQEAPIASTPRPGGLHESSLNFSVQGDMKLNLFFNIGGKSVQLNIKEEGFEIELDGGMKFSIPLNDSNATEKKAA